MFFRAPLCSHCSLRMSRNWAFLSYPKPLVYYDDPERDSKGTFGLPQPPSAFVLTPKDHRNLTAPPRSFSSIESLLHLIAIWTASLSPVSLRSMNCWCIDGLKRTRCQHALHRDVTICLPQRKSAEIHGKTTVETLTSRSTSYAETSNYPFAAAVGV